MGLREPLYELHQLCAPRVRHARRRGLPAADQPGTINQFFHAHYTPAEAQKLIAEQAGELAGTDPQNLNDKGIH